MTTADRNKFEISLLNKKLAHISAEGVESQKNARVFVWALSCSAVLLACAVLVLALSHGSFIGLGKELLASFGIRIG